MAEEMKTGHTGRLPAPSSNHQLTTQTCDESGQSAGSSTQKLLVQPTYTSHRPQNSSHSTPTPGPGSTSPASDVHQTIKPPDEDPRTATLAMRTERIVRLAKFIASGCAFNIDLQHIDHTTLKTAELEPPVTIDSLSELDIERILSDPKLRHDLNFDQDVSFRPNYDGERGMRKKALARQYWAVLAVELAFYMHVAIRRDATVLTGSSISRRMVWRLPRMFTTIRDILKTLVRSEDADSIDQNLDVDLLMQQLENGVCDLASVAEWLGLVIKGSCSPVRDAFVSSVVEQMKHSVAACDPCSLSFAIEQLFSILEIMKLDVANHQIRNLRLFMIGETIQFSQKYFVQYLAKSDKFDRRSACIWFRQRLNAHLRHPANASTSVSNLHVLARATVDLLPFYLDLPRIPHTFGFDYDRLLEYRAAFHVHCAREAIVSAFTALRNLISRKPVPPALDSESLLLHRISQLDPSFSRTLCHYQPPDEVVLEIARAAYESIGSFDSLPAAEDFDFAFGELSTFLNVDTSRGAEVQAKVWRSLQELVQHEVERMLPMDELEMLNYCERVSQSSGSAGSVGMATGRRELQRASRQVEGSPNRGLESLSILATKVAHVALLHWRVWGPILYEPFLEIEEDTFDVDDLDDDCAAEQQCGADAAFDEDLECRRE